MVQNFEYLILNDAAGTYFTAPRVYQRAAV